MQITPTTLAASIRVLASPLDTLDPSGDLLLDSLRILAAERGYQLAADPLLTSALEVGVTTEFLIDYDASVKVASGSTPITDTIYALSYAGEITDRQANAALAAIWAAA